MDDPFYHDEESFERIEAPASSAVADADAKYADLYAEVIWDGVITEEKRARLETAAQTFGLDAERVASIESALSAAHKNVKEPNASRPTSRKSIPRRSSSDADEKVPQTVSPLAQASDPRLLMLQRRIELLEKEKSELSDKHAALADTNERLEQLVSQLQHALEETMNDLERVGKQFSELESSAGVDPAEAVAADDESGPVSTVQPLSDDGPQAKAAGKEDKPDAAEEAAQDKPSEGRRGLRSRRAFRGSELPPASPELKREAKLRPSRGDPVEIHRLVRMAPRDPELLRALFQALQRADDIDRRWCIASALVFLGEANDAERELFVEHGQTGLVRPRRAVNEDEWRELLLHPDQSALTGQILAEIAPAVLLGHATAIRASLAPDEIGDSQRVDPDTSTIQAARCFSWASAFLGLSTPTLYTAPDSDLVARMVLDPKPSLKVGKAALVGRSTRELAFIAGRSLTWFRREHLLGQALRSLRSLEDSFLAALMIGNPGLPMTPEIKSRVTPIRATLTPLLDEAAVKRLEANFAKFVELGGRTNLTAWMQAVDRTSACTGLLLSNDLYAARDMLQLEGADDIEERMDELIVFYTAGRCSLLRKRIGISVNSGKETR